MARCRRFVPTLEILPAVAPPSGTPMAAPRPPDDLVSGDLIGSIDWILPEAPIDAPVWDPPADGGSDWGPPAGP